MKILYLITQSEWGGAQKYVYELATNLSSRGFDISVACGAGGILIDKLQERNIKVFVLKNLVRPINPYRDLLAFFKISKLIKREKPDLVHTSSSKAEILGNLAARLAGSKVIFTAHGFVFNEATGFKRKILIWLERLAAKWADKIIAVSEFDRQNAINEKIMTAKKIITIHHGLNLEFFKNFKKDTVAIRNRIGMPTNAPLVGTAANFYKTKGLKFLIEAAAIVIKKIPSARFLIAGDGELRPQLEKQIRNLGLQNKIFLIGFREDALEIIAALDVFALSSLKEGLPFVLLEAGAFGRPVAATQVGGVPEIVDHAKNGLLVPPADANSLAAAIFSLLSDKKTAEKFGSSLQKKIFSNFDFKKTLRETEAIYKNVIPPNRCGQ